MNNQFSKWFIRIAGTLKQWNTHTEHSKGITSDEINTRNSTSPYWIEITTKADLYQSKLAELLQKYSSSGIVGGHELLLRPSDALRLAKDLQEVGIAILGLDCWYSYFGSLREDTSVELYVGDDIVWGSSPVIDSAAKVQEFILNRLPKYTQYVSFTFDIPADWPLFPD